MKSLRVFLVAAALAAPLAGCVVHGHSGHVGVGVGVGVCDHHYMFYPDYDAYHCGGCGYWWTLDGGAWVEFRTRPAHIVLGPSVAVVRVEERGPSPWVHHDSHRRKGPPPGRGWRK